MCKMITSILLVFDCLEVTSYLPHITMNDNVSSNSTVMRLQQQLSITFVLCSQRDTDSRSQSALGQV